MVRVDRNRPLETMFRTNAEGTGAWIWNVGQSEDILAALVSEIAQGTGLVLRAWDYRSVSHTYGWSIAGAETALQRLACFGT